MSGDPTGIKLEFDPARQRMNGVAIHGNVPFDVPYISEIVPGLWTGGCRDGLILPRFFKHLVSLYQWEKYRVKHDLASILVVKMYDDDIKNPDQVCAIADWVSSCMDDGPVLVHCQAGLNRSALIAATALMHREATAEEAISLIRKQRSPACLCNKSFENWLRGKDRES